jgi:diacylglycerol O-acyltransferase
MALCSGALRRYLQEHDALEADSLIAMLPVSMHGETDKGGNQVATILANLATNERDPLKRLARIVASTKAAKERMSKMVRLEKIAHTMMMMSPMLPGIITGRAATHPAFNLVISNVPGPRKDLYLNGAHLDETYPVSIPMEYQAMNITVTSYVDEMAFGFTACRRAVPHMQRMIDYLDQSFVELEQVLGLAPLPTAARRTAGAASRPKVAAKTPAAAARPKVGSKAPATAAKPKVAAKPAGPAAKPKAAPKAAGTAARPRARQA